MTFVKLRVTILLIIVFNPIVNAHAQEPQRVRYDLVIAEQPVSIAGDLVHALTINGNVPGPTLHFNLGDTAHVVVHNKLDVESSIHWHGILLPNKEDGVPYVTTVPIDANDYHMFEFVVRQTGTYWYHGHTGLQEQRGVYGGIVINEVNGHQADVDSLIILSDWTNSNPSQLWRTLKSGNDWFQVEKNSVISWDRIIATRSIRERLRSSFRRMPSMDIADVSYDAFLANGEPVVTLSEVAPGDHVRLRFVNAGASSYFVVNYAGGGLTVVAADGLPVKPLQVDEFQIAIGETYDVLVSIPEGDGSYELRATALDGSGYTSVLLGDGPVVEADSATLPDPLSPMMHMEMEGMMPMDMQDDNGMKDHNHDTTSMDPHSNQILSYDQLVSTTPTSPDPRRSIRLFTFKLTGDMERYVWSMNGKTLSESDKVMIKAGELVRFELTNGTMMHHPMHLHGHFFRVINGQGERSPLKHTVDVAPMGTVTIEFEATEDKDWFFHCHILYHMMSGMARIVRYEGSTVEPELARARRRAPRADDTRWFSWFSTAPTFSGTSGEAHHEGTRTGFSLDWKNDWTGHYEIHPSLNRYVGRFLQLFVGAELEDDENVAISGIRYVLPLLLEAEIRVDHTGILRLQIEREHAITRRTRAGWMIASDKEWRVEMDYLIRRHVAITGNIDSEFPAGVGIKFIY